MRKYFLHWIHIRCHLGAIWCLTSAVFEHLTLALVNKVNLTNAALFKAWVENNLLIEMNLVKQKKIDQYLLIRNQWNLCSLKSPLLTFNYRHFWTEFYRRNWTYEHKDSNWLFPIRKPSSVTMPPHFYLIKLKLSWIKLNKFAGDNQWLITGAYIPMKVAGIALVLDTEWH